MAKYNSKHMGTSGLRTKENLRSLMTHECARFMAESGIRDFARAKRKAGDKLAIPGGSFLPSNVEIEAAAIEHRRLFQSSENHALVCHGLTVAAELMEGLQSFQPRLGGSLLKGYATPRSVIEIYVTADTDEEILNWLQLNHIPAQCFEKRLKFGKKTKLIPGFCFQSDSAAISLPVEIIVLSTSNRSQPPLSVVDGRPMKSVNYKTLLQMYPQFPGC